MRVALVVSAILLLTLSSAIPAGAAWTVTIDPPPYQKTEQSVEWEWYTPKPKVEEKYETTYTYVLSGFYFKVSVVVQTEDKNPTTSYGFKATVEKNGEIIYDYSYNNDVIKKVGNEGSKSSCQRDGFNLTIEIYPLARVDDKPKSTSTEFLSDDASISSKQDKTTPYIANDSWSSRRPNQVTITVKTYVLNSKTVRESRGKFEYYYCSRCPDFTSENRSTVEAHTQENIVGKHGKYVTKISTVTVDPRPETYTEVWLDELYNIYSGTSEGKSALENISRLIKGINENTSYIKFFGEWQVLDNKNKGPLGGVRAVLSDLQKAIANGETFKNNTQGKTFTSLDSVLPSFVSTVVSGKNIKLNESDKLVVTAKAAQENAYNFVDFSKKVIKENVISKAGNQLIVPLDQSLAAAGDEISLCDAEKVWLVDDDTVNRLATSVVFIKLATGIFVGLPRDGIYNEVTKISSAGIPSSLYDAAASNYDQSYASMKNARSSIYSLSDLVDNRLVKDPDSIVSCFGDLERYAGNGIEKANKAIELASGALSATKNYAKMGRESWNTVKSLIGEKMKDVPESLKGVIEGYYSIALAYAAKAGWT